jgi:hypothetical protein
MRIWEVWFTIVVSTTCLPGWSHAQQFPDGFFSPEGVENGERLARVLCAACHLFPEPGLLDRDTWFQGPMPWMMSVTGLSPGGLPQGIDGESIRKSGLVFCSSPVSKDEFGMIPAYYLNQSPLSLAVTDRPTAALDLALFRPSPLPYGESEPAALVVSIDEANRQIRVGNAATRSLDFVGRTGRLLHRVDLGDTPVSVHESVSGLYLTFIGNFPPSEQPKGSVVFLPQRENVWGSPQALLKGLIRPVHTSICDLNGDARLDLMVSQFGWYSGRLSWFQAHEGGSFEEHELLPKPGALRTEVMDLNGDGHKDIVSLVAQATEKLSIFHGDGTGEFVETVLFQKHPAFGHTSFELADMNGDGLLDILTTNGDNGDYPSPPKPYHGVRIYLNQGDGRFAEQMVLPLPGAGKVMGRDFDVDGDLDLACISYYPDYATARHEGFVCLENEGGLKFTAPPPSSKAQPVGG